MTDATELVEALRDRKRFVAEGPRYLMQMCDRAADFITQTQARATAAEDRIEELEADLREAQLASQMARRDRDHAEEERDRALALLNAPELHDFAAGVVQEAAHQRERWGSDHDGGKEPEDWFWLLGWLGGKVARAAREGDHEKALHHCISTAAALANWHAALLGYQGAT